jgi:hypothetical protein
MPLANKEARIAESSLNPTFNGRRAGLSHALDLSVGRRSVTAKETIRGRMEIYADRFIQNHA